MPQSYNNIGSGGWLQNSTNLQNAWIVRIQVPQYCSYLAQKSSKRLSGLILTLLRRQNPVRMFDSERLNHRT
jgi:hypothetical protein